MRRTIWKWILRVFGYALLFFATLGLGICFGNIAICFSTISDIGLLVFVYSLIMDEPGEGGDLDERE